MIVREDEQRCKWGAEEEAEQEKEESDVNAVMGNGLERKIIV